MTEQTIEKIDTTILHLGGMVRAAESRLEMEAHEYAAKRDRMVKVAHKRGTDNGIGSALDDLLEEFGLPRRPWRGTLQALVQMEFVVDDWRGGQVRTAGGRRDLYHVAGTRVLQPYSVYHDAHLYEGVCLCEHAEGPINEWIVNAFGADNLAGARYRVALPSCGHNDCPNAENRRTMSGMYANDVAAFDFSGFPSQPVVLPAT